MENKILGQKEAVGQTSSEKAPKRIDSPCNPEPYERPFLKRVTLDAPIMSGPVCSYYTTWD